MILLSVAGVARSISFLITVTVTVKETRKTLYFTIRVDKLQIYFAVVKGLSTFSTCNYFEFLSEQIEQKKRER